MTWRPTLAASTVLLGCTATPITSQHREPAPALRVELARVPSESDQLDCSTAFPGESPQAQLTRQTRRDQLTAQIGSMPGWALYESAHYFLLTCVDEAKFVDELKERCESIRRAIEKDFPHPELDPVPIHTAPSVIRVLKDREQYLTYGGPPGSSGYWTSADGEIVLYDDQLGGGRNDTWATLNGMVFLEYVSSISDDAVTAPWFLYGHSDYYSGFRYVDREHHPAPFHWRERHAQLNVRSSKLAALQDFVRWTQSEYYGANPGSLAGGDCCAQGWSLVWFLRQGRTSKHWNAAWDEILGTWWETWLETRDRNAATDRAFAGVDWRKLHTAWEAFTREL